VQGTHSRWLSLILARFCAFCYELLAECLGGDGFRRTDILLLSLMVMFDTKQSGRIVMDTERVGKMAFQLGDHPE